MRTIYKNEQQTQLMYHIIHHLYHKVQRYTTLNQQNLPKENNSHISNIHLVPFTTQPTLENYKTTTTKPKEYKRTSNKGKNLLQLKKDHPTSSTMYAGPPVPGTHNQPQYIINTGTEKKRNIAATKLN